MFIFAAIRHGSCFRKGMGRAITTFLADPSGVTGIEYGVIACSIALILVSAAASAGHHLQVLFHIAAALSPDGSPALHH